MTKSHTSSLFQFVLRRLENPPNPSDGPEFHAEHAFWLTGIRRDLDKLAEADGRLREWAAGVVLMVELNALDVAGIEGIRRSGQEILNG